MKKVGKCLVLILIAFLIGISNTFAKEYDLQTIGELVLEEDPNAESFYIIGKYIFTMSYVKENNLDTEDFMLAARSINLLETDGKVKGTEAYKKMSVYQILSHTDDDGSVTDWYVSSNLIGQNKIDNNTKFEVGFINYTEIKNIYTVIFQDENGQEIIRHEVIEGKNVEVPMNNIKDGYYFIGWYTEDDNIFDVFEKSITQDLILKQKWTAKTVTIKFDGEVDGPTETTYTYPDIIPSDLKEIKPKSQEGYIFKYWYDSDLDNPSAFDFNAKLELSIDDIAKTTTLKAKFEAAHKVNFKAEVDGKANNSFIKTDLLQYANAENKLQEAQISSTDQEGYNFLGWYNENDEKINPTDYTFTNMDNTVVGKWTTKVYTVTFNTDGGTEISNRQVKHGEKVENPGNAEKISNDNYNGYEFIDWELCKDNICETFDFNTQITSNITLKAKYKQVVYTNKMMNDFASQITNDNISAFVREDKKLDIAIVNGEESLSQNIGDVVKVLSKFVEVKNVDAIKLNTSIALTKQNVQEELQKLLNSLTNYETAKLEDLYNVSFTINFSLKNGFTNETDSSTSTYTAEFDTNFVIVKNESELKNALSGGKEIIIKNWEGTINSSLTISQNTVIDGRGNNITSNIKENKPVFNITAGSVVIKDLDLTIDVLKPSEYNKETMNATTTKNTIGIEVGENATLTANNFHVKNKETIDATNMKIENDELKASTVTINENAAILLKGTLYASNISYQDEIYGSPTVLATKDATINVLGGNKQEYIYNIIRKTDGTSEKSERVSKYIHYYKDYKNSRLIFVNYVPMSRTYTNIAYINNEQYFVPTTYDENGSNYKYLNEITEKKYLFKGEWDYSSELESGTITTDSLKQKKATLTSGDYIYYAQYEEIPAPVIKEFYIGNQEQTTTSNNAVLHLTWDSDNVIKYCILKDNGNNDKTNCVWEDAPSSKEVTKDLNFDKFDNYTYYAYLKNNEELNSKEATTTISYIKKDFNGTAKELMNYEPKGLSGEVKDGMYRYSGKDVENYICFGTSDVNTCLSNTNQYLYQIIGVTEGGKFKLIKTTAYGWKIWNDKYMYQSCGVRGVKCKYTNSKIYTTLNKDFAETLLDWDKKVDNATWYIGAITSDNITAHDIYQSEIKESTYNGKYGLMYASDYFYAYDGIGNKNCQKESCESFLSSPYNTWTITRQDYDSNAYTGYAYYANSSEKRLRSRVMDVEYAVRPVFYLFANTSITSGIGSKDRPFIIN